MGVRNALVLHRAGREGGWVRFSRRGALEIGLVALVCSLAAGAVIGSGLAQTVLATPDPLTWLRNNRGQVVQVNPETGTMLNRLQIGDPCQSLQVAQGDGVLAVTDPCTNEVTLVDLSLLRVAGVRQGDPGVEVLLSGRQIYVLNKEAGRIERLNPLTAEPVGQPWQADGPLADAAIASDSQLWTVTIGGRLVSLRWSDNPGRFAEQQRHDLPGVSADTVLVAHQQGVTAVSPGGSAAQFGTGADRTQQADGLAAPLAAPDLSPARLVPVSSPKPGKVHLVRDNGVVQVAGPPLGCRNPAKPAVYRDRVYVPCPGDRKVLVLDAAGRRAEPDLKTPPGRDVELVVNAGLLIVNVADGKQGLVVKPDGTTQTLDTDDPQVQVNDPDARPTALPSGLGIRPPRPGPPANRPGQDPAKSPASKKPGGQQGSRPGSTPSDATPGGQIPDPTLRGQGTPSPGDDDGPSPDPSSTVLEPTPSGGTPSPDPDPIPTDPVPTDPVPATSPPPSDADFTPGGVDASTMLGGNVAVFWTPPRIKPDSYEILRADTEEVLATPPVDRDTSVIEGLAGQQVRFIVVAITNGRRYASVPSGPPSPLPLPGAPTVSIQLAALAPASFTVRATVGEVPSGASYGVSVTVNGTSRVANRTDMPASAPTSDFTFPCTGPADPCLTGGSVTADASMTTEAGTGPVASVTATIPAPPQFQFNGWAMFVSNGGKCFDVDLRLHTCSGSSGQLWSIRNTGEIRNQSNNQCLSSPDRLHFSTDCDAPPDDQRWDVLGSGNRRGFRNQDTDRCLAVNADTGGEGVQVTDLGCQFNNQDTWFVFTPALPLTAPWPASFARSATEDSRQSGLGEASAALLLLPLAVGLVRRQQRRRQAR